MKLTLTIQDVKTKEGLMQAVFGTLNVSIPDEKGKYDNKKDINFVTNIKEIKGLPKIVRNIQVEALALKNQERLKKINDKKVTKKRSAKKSSRKTNKV